MKLILSVVVLAGLVGPAAADDKKRAATHLKQGAAYYKTEQYDAAIAEFEAAYKLDAKPQTLFNIGNAYYKKGDLAKAIESFQRYLAADPDGKFAPQALEFSAIAKKELAEQEAKKRAQMEADRVAAEAKRLAAEQEQKRIAVAARIKQAEAFEAAGTWASAGDEYKALAENGGTPDHLLLAAEAYRKAPALDRARDAYRAYLDKVPMGGKSDHARAQLAAVTSEIAKAEAAANQPVTATAPTSVAPIAVVASAEPAYAGSTFFVHGGLAAAPPGFFSQTGFSAGMGSKYMAVESMAAGYELVVSYAVQGRHAITTTFTAFNHIQLEDDETPRSVYIAESKRFGFGYRYMTRRGHVVRPTFGVHLAYRTARIIDQESGAAPLTTTEDSGLPHLVRFDPELAIVFEGPKHIGGQIAVRPDIIGVVSGTFVLTVITIGVGAHF